MKTINLTYIKIKQKDKPFFLTNIEASVLYSHGEIVRQSEDTEEGIQRYLDKSRVNSIADFCRNKKDNPLFLTPIVVSLNSDHIDKNLLRGTNETGDFKLSYDEEDKDVFNIIDGQHRLMGIKQYEENEGKPSLELAVAFVLDADVFDAAEIFLDINSNQKKVDWSTMYNLFGLMERKSGTKTVPSFASKIVSILNNNNESPFHRKIKMLGRKTDDGQFISQATIAHKITDNIWRRHNGQHRAFTYFYEKDDFEILAKILINFFNAFKKIYPDVWEDSEGLAKKAVGYSALMNFLIFIINDGVTDFTQKKIERILENVGNNLDNQDKTNEGKEKMKLLFKNSGSSESVATKIGNKLCNTYDNYIK